MNKAFRIRVLLLTLAVCGVLAAVLFPFFVSLREGGHISCWSNVKYIGTALIMYRQDYDEVLPPMNSPEIFKTALIPYQKFERLFSCPTLKSPYLPLALLSNVPVWRIEDPAQTEFLRDSDFHPSSKPENKMINIGFVDGHAKALPAPPAPIKLLTSPKPPEKPKNVLKK